jgi:hypothetical protein
MAKKQTRRSISVSRSTYERLKAYCEASNISMSQLVETRVNDFLGEGGSSPSIVVTPISSSLSGARPTTSFATSSSQVERPIHALSSERPATPPAAPRPAATAPSMPRPMAAPAPAPRPFAEPPRAPAPPPQQPAAAPMTSSAARSIVEPPPPIIKPRQQESAPKPAEKRPDQIFTF